MKYTDTSQLQVSQGKMDQVYLLYEEKNFIF